MKETNWKECNSHVVAFAASAGFRPVEDLTDRIVKDTGLSRSAIFRTILCEFMGVPEKNPEIHAAHVKVIKQALRRA